MNRYRVARVVFTLAILALLAWRIDTGALAAQFDAIQPVWAAAALALTVPQVVISAWRWRLTARHIGLHLPMALAVREYYLATFLNQVLPGGVLGDASRAWRHARADHDPPAAWHAVIIERVSGQLTLALVALIALACAPTLRDGLRGAAAHAAGSPVRVWAGAAVLLVGAGIGLSLRHGQISAGFARFIRHMRHSLFDSRVGWAQFASSLCVVATYIGVFLLCARTIGLDTPIGELAPLIPPVLLAMALPLSIAGWGLREGAAALVWMVAGLPVSEGVALSLAYGVTVLASSLPGALVLLARQRAVAPA